MVSQKTRDEILLYWSGEADVTQVAKIRVLLECDPEARVYFDELAGFDVLRDRLASLSSTPSSGSFAERAVFEVSTKKNYWWGIRPWVSVAAVVIVILAAVNIVWPRDEEREETVDREETQEDGITPTGAPKRQRLSQRLFTRDRYTARVQKISIARERARKLRIQLDKFPQL